MLELLGRRLQRLLPRHDCFRLAVENGDVGFVGFKGGQPLPTDPVRVLRSPAVAEAGLGHFRSPHYLRTVVEGKEEGLVGHGGGGQSLVVGRLILNDLLEDAVAHGSLLEVGAVRLNLHFSGLRRLTAVRMEVELGHPRFEVGHMREVQRAAYRAREKAVHHAGSGARTGVSWGLRRRFLPQRRLGVAASSAR